MTRVKNGNARASTHFVRTTPITGSGGYKELAAALKPVVAKALREGGAMAGRMAGNRLGLPSERMASLGRAAGAKVSRLVGAGAYGLDPAEYKMNPSVFKNDTIFGNVNAFASLESAGLNCTVVTAREFVGDIYTSTAGTTVFTDYNINPGLARTFQRLAEFANNFEMYSIGGLVFEYISSSSPYISSSSLGTVGMTCRRNMYSGGFTNKQSFDNTEGAISFRIDQNGLYGVECAPALTPQELKYIRNGSSTVPIGLTDHGIFTMAVFPGANIPANSPIGELWVTYKVCLIGPTAPTLTSGLYRATGSGAATGTPLYSALSTTVSYGLDITTTSNTIILPPDRIGMVYRVTVTWVGTSAICTLPVISYNSAISGGTGSLVTSPSPSTTVSPGPATTAASLCWDALLTVSAGSPTLPTITFASSGSSFPASATTTIKVVAIGYVPQANA